MADAETEIEAIRKGLEDGSLKAEIAMARLVALMRDEPGTPGAKELYREASKRAYTTRQSSLSHSHPPPPAGPDEGDEEV